MQIGKEIIELLPHRYDLITYMEAAQDFATKSITLNESSKVALKKKVPVLYIKKRCLKDTAEIISHTTALKKSFGCQEMLMG